VSFPYGGYSMVREGNYAFKFSVNAKQCGTGCPKVALAYTCGDDCSDQTELSIMSCSEKKISPGHSYHEVRQWLPAGASVFLVNSGDSDLVLNPARSYEALSSSSFMATRISGNYTS